MCKNRLNEIELFCVLIEKPGKPDAPEVGKLTKDSVHLTWKPPKDDGGSEIFNYVVEYRVEGGFKWVRSNKKHVAETAYTVINLMEDADYEFRISAENRAGVGPPSDPSKPVKVKEPVCK